MPKPGTRMPRAAATKTNTRASVLLCLLMAGVVAVAVHRWGAERCASNPAESTYTATAYIVQEPNKGGREAGIPISCTDTSAKRAEDAANALAEGYAADRRLESKRRATEPTGKARRVADTARVEYAACEAMLEALRAETVESDAKPQTTPEGQAAARPMIDNPEWVDLEGQLQQLEQRRDSLLVDRTPLHPAVVEATQRIEDVKRQMAVVPRQIPGKAGKAAEPVLTGRPTAKPNPTTLAAATEFVAMVGEFCREAEAAEKRSAPAQIAATDYKVVRAEAVENQPPVEDLGWRLWGTMGVAGALMAFGVGSISVGASIDPPVGTVAQVQSAARAPVVGLIPADRPISDPRGLNRRKMRARLAFLAAGVLMMAACPAAAAWGVLGVN